jgi:hypothetical protein
MAAPLDRLRGRGALAPGARVETGQRLMPARVIEK